MGSEREHERPRTSENQAKVNKEDKVFWTQGGVPVHVQLVIQASCSSQKSFQLAQNKIFDSRGIDYSSSVI